MNSKPIKFGSCLCYTLILLPLVGIFNCGRGFALSNIHVLTYLPGWDIHVLACQPGSQLPTYMSLPAKQSVSSQGGLGNLSFTRPLLKMEILFMIVSLLVQVSLLCWGPSQGQFTKTYP